MRARLLDITRLCSRMAKGFDTGIDRVETAYAQELTVRDDPCLFITRIAGSYAILERQAMQRLLATRFEPSSWPATLLKDRLRIKLSPQARQARSHLRHLASCVTSRRTLPKRLMQLGFMSFEYLNLGHSHIDPKFLETIQKSGGRLRFMLHDTIPLTHPEYTRPEECLKFSIKFRHLCHFSDEIICNSQVTLDSLMRLLPKDRADMPLTVAHLGLSLPTSRGLSPVWPRPFMICLGTIEARKNHMLLLQLWEHLSKSHDALPDLLLIGRRGWRNEAFFAEFEKSPLRDRLVFELNAVDDAELTQFIAQAKAMLFPSFVEGYGLPPLEAAANKVPLICNDLPVYREFLSDYPVYVKSSKVADWASAITPYLGTSPPPLRQMPALPSWPAHFAITLGPSERQERGHVCY